MLPSSQKIKTLVTIWVQTGDFLAAIPVPPWITTKKFVVKEDG